MTDTLWVLGAGGLLGSAVVRASASRRTDRESVLVVPVPWDDPEAAAVVFSETVARLNRQYLSSPGDTLRVAWCAGAGVVASQQDQFAREAAVVEALVSALGELVPGLLAGLSVFVASSAGGVYAGSSPAPHDEFSATSALVPYGFAKLRLEQQFSEFAGASGARVVLGRIANLYGPGQNLGKGQGLISTLLWGALQGSPVKVYVDLDTVRDYLFVDDAAAMVMGSLDLAALTDPGTVTIKVIASGNRVTVFNLLHVVRRISSQRPLVVQGSSPLRTGQVRDLSLTSRVWPELDELASTSLLVGVHRTYLDLQRARLEAHP
ncbi:NAD-dependent epimerase/dehydratase family protein [Aestuariimicrobium kwangyangense]|uniref:NAD-dependent epimerase/dehydratase family protein n=1 Tax=Aestuariimicrobium kwangyangense TaxID=396389 RepID=UPI0003B56B11|nr:NAD-dependent epimerase/dehydratase family protein [Aestuariimicrobium kwangyangense]